MRFQNRQEAGEQLGQVLARRLPSAEPGAGEGLVLGLPRGGVPVAAEVARALGWPLDVLAVRKIGAPGQPELALGALASGGMQVLNLPLMAQLGLTEADLAPAIAAEQAELARRTRLFREDRPFPEISGRTVVVVDDGLATGATALAAVRALRQGHPGRLVLAVPVGSVQAVALLAPQVDDLVCLHTPEPFEAVGLWYTDFRQTTDAEVQALLARGLYA